MEQGARDAVADGARLARAATPGDGDDDVEPLGRLGQHQGLLDDHLEDFIGEVRVDRPAVDLDVARAGAQVDAGRSRLAPSRSVTLRSEERRVGEECRSRWWPYRE